MRKLITSNRNGRWNRLLVYSIVCSGLRPGRFEQWIVPRILYLSTRLVQNQSPVGWFDFFGFSKANGKISTPSLMLFIEKKGNRVHRKEYVPSQGRATWERPTKVFFFSFPRPGPHLGWRKMSLKVLNICVLKQSTHTNHGTYLPNLYSKD